MKRNHNLPRSRSPKATSPVAAAAPPARPLRQLGVAALAIEVWRLGRRILAAPGTSERIVDSHARLVRLVEDGGIRVDDPLGRRFVEGTHAEIIDMPDGADPVTESIVVTEVLRPAVYVDDICVVIPQIILGRTEQKEGNHAQDQH